MNEGRIAIGALILFSLWLFVGLPWLLSPLERIEYREIRQPAAEHPENQPNGTAQSPYFVHVIPSPKSAQERAEEAEDREEKKSSDRWLVRWTAALFAATVGLILATGVLGYFGQRQSRDMKASIEAANRANELNLRNFVSVHRPRMRLKHAWFTDQTRWRLGGPLEINLDMVNVGNTPAQVTMINYQSILIPKGERLPQRPPYDEIPASGIRISRFKTEGILPSGVTLARTVCDGILDQNEVHDILWGNVSLYLIGTIEYWDNAGLRQTAFCRRFTYLDYPPKSGDLGRFVVEDDADYDYED